MVWRSSAASRLQAPIASAASYVELPRGHIPALDAIRGLAIVAVTLYRFGGGGDGPARAITDPWLIAVGSRGVDLFFVLSGFLITGILYDAKEQQHYFRNFYIRRSLRIFPLYYLSLLLALVVLPRFSTEFAAAIAPVHAQQGWLCLYGANIVQTIRGEWCLGPLNHFWSLAIEEHFYLVWPAVIYFLSRKAAMWTCLALFGFSVASRGLWLALGGNGVAAEVFTPLRMEGLVFGAWVALEARGPLGLGRLMPWAKASLILCGVAALTFDLMGRRVFGLPHAMWAMTCAALLILAIGAPAQSWLGRLGKSRQLRFFGKYSYAMYVVQLPLVYLLAPIMTADGLGSLLGGPFLGQAVYCFMMFALTTGLALASWYLFEGRVLALKRYFEMGR